MKLKYSFISWIEKAIDEVVNCTGHGNVTLVFHIRDGRVEWTEKSKRITEKRHDIAK